MKKHEKNKQIVAEIRLRIKKLGLEDKIDIFPVENVCTFRPRYWCSEGIGMFKVHMWDINQLEGKELSDAIDARITDARLYFRI